MPRRWAHRRRVPQSAPSLPHLVLPDRCAQLQRVDGEAGGLERLGAVRSADDGDDGALAQRQAAGAMDQHDPARFRPALTQFGVDRLEARHHLRLVRLIRQRLDMVAQHTLFVECMVANRAAEQHHSATFRQHRPLVGSGDRQRITGQAEP